MPTLDQVMRRQDAVVWEKAGTNAAGDPTVSAAIELLASERNGVRWITSRREIRDPQGNVIAIDAEVLAGRDVPIHSLMWEGTLDEIPGTSEIPTSNIFQVVVANKIPDVKGRRFHYELMLMRYHDTFPEVV